MSISQKKMSFIDRLCGPILNRFLKPVSLFYVFLPSLLFLLGWTKPLIAVPASILLLVGAYLCSRPEGTTIETQDEPVFSPKLLFLILILTVVIVTISGIGGFSSYSVDSWKHESFLKNLIQYDWPIGYENVGPEKKEYMLATYIGYYLPAAAVGKVFGWYAANIFGLLWGILGIFLTVLWFQKVVGKASFWLVIIFLFFGGMDIIGYAILKAWPQNASEVAFTNLDVWMFGLSTQKLPWILPSNLTLLFLGPHHILPNWIILLMSLHQIFYRRSSRDILLLWAATPVGSAFFFVGMAPYVILGLLMTRLRKVFSFQNMVSALILVFLVGFFIISNNGKFPHGWIWEYYNLLEVWPLLFLFCVLEFGLYAAYCPKNEHPSSNSPPRYWFWLSIITIFSCTMYKLGNHCEFTSKTTIPSMVVFVVCLAVSIKNAVTVKEKVYAHTLKILLVIGFTTGLIAISNTLYGGLHAPIKCESVPHFDHYIKKNSHGVQQLLADPAESFFWKYIAAKFNPPPVQKDKVAGIENE
jgi:hypothetical protein